MIDKMIRSILTAKSLWIWGVTFSILWLLVGALLLSQYVGRQYIYYFIGVVTSAIVVWVFTNLMSNLSSNIMVSSTSLFYAFRFTKLTPHKYLLYYLLSTTVATLIIGFMMLGFSVGLFYIEYHQIFLPSNILEFVGVLLFSSMFIILFSVLLATIFPPRYYQLAQMLPQLLYFLLVLGQMLTSYPYFVIIASPFNDMELLLFEAYTSLQAPESFLNPFQSTIPWYYILSSLIIWSLSLFIVDSYLLLKLKPISIDSLRQF